MELVTETEDESEVELASLSTGKIHQMEMILKVRN